MFNDLSFWMRFRSLLGAVFSFVLLSFVLASNGQAADQKTPLYVGTYTGPQSSQGIYRLELDTSTGQLSKPVAVGEAVNPSFLALAPDERHLYAVSEVAQLDGQKTGGVTAFSIDASSGRLTRLNQQPCGGAGPCHLVVDKLGKCVLVANYGGGSAAVLPIESDGRLGAMSCFVQHTGSSVDKSRQAGPHAHSINLDAANRFAFVADLGLDKVLVYKFDPTEGKLTPNSPPAADCPPGSGPRHFAFPPDGRHAYVIHEMTSTVGAFRYNPDAGVLDPQQLISTLPADFQGSNTTAEVQVHPSGKFLYGSNRGHNSIAVFKIFQTGKLELVGHQREGIKTPRNFGIDPSGQFLIVANQDGHSLIAFRIDPESGELQPTGSVVEIRSPVCVKFVRL
jgi:6-phosphogluconolactonase